MCVVDECITTPCGMQQSCKDDRQLASATGDFTCTCSNGEKAVGRPAECLSGSANECDSNPCGAQDCTDPDTTAGSPGDFVCTCTTGTGSAVGKTADCSVDECLSKPCGRDRTVATHRRPQTVLGTLLVAAVRLASGPTTVQLRSARLTNV